MIMIMMVKITKKKYGEINFLSKFSTNHRLIHYVIKIKRKKM